MSDRPLFERRLDDLLPACDGRGGAPGSTHRADHHGRLPVDQLAAIGWAQRRLIRVFLIDSSLAVALFARQGTQSESARSTDDSVFVVLAAVAAVGAVAWVVAAFDLARRLFGTAVALLIVVGQLVPIGCPISFFALDKIASAALSEQGIRVGLWGVHRDTLLNFRLGPGGRWALCNNVPPAA
ncbi:MAG: hypothetical protein U0804_06840 [Gemmataceae bacterium]